MLVRTAREIGLLIRDQRRRAHLSQRELAARLGVSRQWIVEVERGKPRAALDLVLRTLSALGVHLDVSQRARPSVALIEPASTANVDLDAVIDRARRINLPADKDSAASKARKRGKANATNEPRRKKTQNVRSRTA